METNNFTPITANKGKENEITFNTDKEYYDYFKKNKKSKIFMIIGDKEIPLQTEQYLTISLDKK